MYHEPTQEPSQHEPIIDTSKMSKGKAAALEGMAEMAEKYRDGGDLYLPAKE